MSEGDVAGMRPGSGHATPAYPNMIWIRGGSFRVGTERHHPEKAPTHRGTVDVFWIETP